MHDLHSQSMKRAVVCEATGTFQIVNPGERPPLTFEAASVTNELLVVFEFAEKPGA